MIQPQTPEVEATIARSRRGPSAPAYWLISKVTKDRLHILTLDRGVEETLPVFSHPEEAEAFLERGKFGAGWRTTESRTVGLISVLYGPCVRVKRVALDPLPEMFARRTIDLISLPRQRFMHHIATGQPL